MRLRCPKPRDLSICLAVADLDRMAAWYQDQLGFTISEQMDFPDPRARVAYLDLDHIRIELIEAEHFVPMRRPDPLLHAGIQGVSQISLYVDDLDEVLDWLVTRSIPLAMDPVTVAALRIRACFIRDPEGNLIEFVQWLGTE